MKHHRLDTKRKLRSVVVAATVMAVLATLSTSAPADASPSRYFAASQTRDGGAYVAVADDTLESLRVCDFDTSDETRVFAQLQDERGRQLTIAPRGSNNCRWLIGPNSDWASNLQWAQEIFNLEGIVRFRFCTLEESTWWQSDCDRRFTEI